MAYAGENWKGKCEMAKASAVAAAIKQKHRRKRKLAMWRKRRRGNGGSAQYQRHNVAWRKLVSMSAAMAWRSASAKSAVGGVAKLATAQWRKSAALRRLAAAMWHRKRRRRIGQPLMKLGFSWRLSAAAAA
jgi:hypothetical protein